MNMERIKTSDDLLLLIQESNNPLPLGKTKSNLIDFTDYINTLSKNSDKYIAILNICRNLADKLENFSDDNFYSLMSFFVLANINDYDTFLSFLKIKDKIVDVDKQALFLKLLFTINRDGLSKQLLNSYKNIKFKYPLFWADICFNIDIYESIKTLKEANLDLFEIEKPLKKWLKSINEESNDLRLIMIHHFIKNDLHAYLDKDNNLVSYKNELKVFAKKIIPQLKPYQYAY